MENNKRTQRTPQEIIAETEARLERLLTREAKQQAKSDPEIVALYELRETLLKSQREATKILGATPQGGNARIAKHNAWVDKIEAEMMEAEQTILVVQRDIAEVDAQISARIKTLMEISEENSSQA
mgnify:CR=1 FL=1|jgi:hypothetical protein